MFTRGTLGALGGRLYPWQRGPSGLRDGLDRHTHKRGAPSRLSIERPGSVCGLVDDEVTFHTEASNAGFRLRLPALLHHDTCGSPPRAVPLRTVQTVRLLQAALPVWATFTVPFFTRPDPGEDDVFRSSVPPAPHGAHACSSALWFDGFRDPLPQILDPPITWPARTWLAQTGWRRHGLVRFTEGPVASPLR